ncbi:MAG TPA: tRNA (adenosine(37)-N6)-dimethylallyltransferase MiaA [Ktedonobacterales bacterium]|jgi:tRNA dimethylallyltransferase|nr:tRNA (adenosine(37)-N6)-dimethylallyltransferase MiaA [Ktedonobacterales bacterium]
MQTSTTDTSSNASHSSQRIPLLALVGPTASGKTALALALADLAPAALGLRGAEIISADSRQIYRLMTIATAKPTADEQARVRHHLLDVVWPDQSYTLAEYQRDAQAAISNVWARGHLPLLVGGTGLYVRAVVDGLAIPEVAPQPELRAKLEAEAARSGPGALLERLRSLDPVAAARIDARNPRRLIRALEVCIVSGRPFSEQQGRRPTPYSTVMVGLSVPREALFARADARISAMLADGLVAETEALVARGYDWSLPAMSSLGYREIGAYLRGENTLAEAITRFEQATHAYIRRQVTWFRPDKRIHWLDASLPPSTLVEQANLAVLSALASARGAASAPPIAHEIAPE